MSINTVMLDRIKISEPDDVVELPVTFQPQIEDTGSLVWSQINDVLRSSLRESGFPQPIETSTRRWPTTMELLIPVAVAPGIVVGGYEHEQRYGCINLEEYRQKMSPELFTAFVRHIGRIPGMPDLELSDIVTTPE